MKNRAVQEGHELVMNQFVCHMGRVNRVRIHCTKVVTFCTTIGNGVNEGGGTAEQWVLRSR
jgi:hypothetical protein